MEAALLVELLTEELPPKSLLRLSTSLVGLVFDELHRNGFVAADVTPQAFATPRRLAFRIPQVHDKAPDRPVEVSGPSVKAGLDANGKPTAALAGFAKKNSVPIESLVQVDTPKGKVFACRKVASGELLGNSLGPIVDQALGKLPIPRLMRWGSGDAQFVRPVHGLVMLHGAKVVPGKVLGIASGNRTRGHRFMSSGEIVIEGADAYEATLLGKGKVVAGFADRRAMIEAALKAEAQKRKAGLGEYADLLDEVTALVEHPSAYAGAFDPVFLEVPQECLILTMRQNQKYFPLFDGENKLIPWFLIVSNMEVADPRQIVSGNQRVVRARLEDARFFYNQDRKVSLASRVPRLASVVYHRKLGSQLDRVERLRKLCAHVAKFLGVDESSADRAAYLSKADLATGMVGEFPELQGLMGMYYARHDQEHAAVCQAIGDQYRLRFDEAEDPENLLSACLYLADRIESLVGLFGAGEVPTGEKDPFGLRRAALGTISVFEVLHASLSTTGRQPFDVREILAFAAKLFRPGVIAATVVDQVHDFILERYWQRLATSYPKTSVEAVISLKPNLGEVTARLFALEGFRELPDAASLAAANKRIRNILRKSEAAEGTLEEPLLYEPAERGLYEAMRRLEPDVSARMRRGDYAGMLVALAGLRGPVDAFFDKVMVNADDPKIRANRHALLRRLDRLLNQVADISKLAA
ncbi:MAG TPA: glycine--tRNA ligase subunit beta [Burkholderiales bacterium]|nr:glycine--tRNA ligase subunit beta [Burkholderiales bacterium]